MSELPHILLVEDSAPQARLFTEYLSTLPAQTSLAITASDAKEAIEKSPPDLILLDLKLPDENGLEVLKWIREKQFPSAVIIITGHGSMDIAVEVMRHGADDFLEKPITADRLRTSVKNHIEKRKLQNLVDDYQSQFEREAYHGFIGASLPMQAVYRIIDAAAPSKASVFISGESGTGKEVCAAAIHDQSNRKEKPFIALNCGAIPRELMESEVFGHKKGAFTGAATDRQGAASQADGGTLFLDEIGEMDMDLQTKLLRFIQTGSFRKVGGNTEEQVDVRFICATNREPLEAVAEGRLREDLYYRLHVVPVQLPALRERGDDIIAIATHFLLSYTKEEEKSFRLFSPEVEVILRRYNWPGNVRQLQNVIRNIVVLHNDEEVLLSHLPPPLDQTMTDQDLSRYSSTQQQTDDTPSIGQPIRPLATVERETIERAIEVCDGNIPKAAGLLDVSPSTIYRKKQAWEVN
ncbi:MAG: sigma-54-dependent Fis family transcriptional regulator [Gammaproteobacteria bacterium]|nr:sigma-54-dependent Fis family transcriptional regulator [Gammaproteobacteria bacterium]